MKRIEDKGIFKPAPTQTEAKSDVTSRVAREIMKVEVNARLEKTERLRAARKAMEDAAEPPPPKPVKKPARKRAKA